MPTSGIEIELINRYDEHLPVGLSAASNLFSNAIKFIPQDGEIVTTIKKNDRQLFIQVKDNGPGIIDDDLPHIFDAFHQSRSSSKGHGLGLAAVKAIVQAHGGRVAVKSSLDIGSVFTVRLPKRK